MGNRFRDLKRRARRDLHQGLEIAALYLLTPASTPVPCTVRVWTKWGALGQMPGKGEGWAEMQEASPKIIFMVADVPNPRKNALVSIERGEAYRVDNTLPPDDISITAEVVRLNPKIDAEKAILDALPVPA